MSLYEVLNSIEFGYFFNAGQLILAITLYAVQLKRRKNFWLRVISSLAVFLFASTVVPSVIENTLGIKAFLFTFACSFVFVSVCFDVDIWNVFLCCTAGAVTQNVSYVSSSMVAGLFGISPTEFSFLGAVIQTPIYVLVHLVVWLLCRSSFSEVSVNSSDRTKIIAISTLLVTCDYVLQMNKHVYQMEDFFVWHFTFLICDVIALFMLFGMYSEAKLREQNAVLNQLILKGNKQYEMSKQTIEMINVKCHDLKHQIGVFKQMEEEDKQRTVEELEKAVMIYDAIAKTGNKAMDVIVSEKSLICEKYGIKFTYIVDGEKLESLSPVDVYTFFANALDNAIEASCNEDENHRVINLSVTEKGSFLRIHVENYTQANVVFKDGIPQTSNQDKSVHGFGVLSMKYIVEKYGGVMSTKLQNNLFCLDVTIPNKKSQD